MSPRATRRRSSERGHSRWRAFRACYSFGGWRGSLFGAVHMYGPEGINFFTRAKVVTSRWGDSAGSRVDLCFPGNS